MTTRSPASSPPAVVFTLFGFAPQQRAWAFAQMAFARTALVRTPGLRFWKLLGTGHGGGFDSRPDFSRYALLTVWHTRAQADEFDTCSALMRRYGHHAREKWRAVLSPVMAHGAWDGTAPFSPVDTAPIDGPVAVLTRATIRPSRLRAFWQAVPGTSEELASAGGRLASIGIGELPLIRQATLSFWRCSNDVRDFAYRSPRHREVIRRTRQEGWYSEELFARFAVHSSEGTWNGVDPLAGAIRAT